MEVVPNLLVRGVLVLGFGIGCGNDTPASAGAPEEGSSSDAVPTPDPTDPETPTPPSEEGSSSSGEPDPDPGSSSGDPKPDKTTGEEMLTSTGMDDPMTSTTGDPTTGGMTSGPTSGTTGDPTTSGTDGTTTTADATTTGGGSSSDGGDTSTGGGSSSTGTAPYCGDGNVDPELDEDCDDANANDLDACHDDCTFHKVTQIALGGSHTCALFDSGNVKCWGHAPGGRLGYGNIDPIGDDEPASAVGFVDVGHDAIAIATGAGHTCVVALKGDVTCFGRNSEGNLGYGHTAHIGDDELPSSEGPITLGGKGLFLSTGSNSYHTCAWIDTDEARCWGYAPDGRLGMPGALPNIGDDEFASAGGPIAIGGLVDDISLGARHTCAVLDGGGVRCWGFGGDGALGYGNGDAIGDDEEPQAAGDVPVGANVVQVSSGWNHTCARTDVGNVRCWGRGNNGRLGYGITAWVGLTNTPADVGDVPLGNTVLHVSAGAAHTCALLDDNSAKCWGAGAQGQLGYGNPDSIGDNELPTAVGDVPVGAPVVAVEAGGTHTCAITDKGTVRCWGNPGEGRLGYGNLDWIGEDETPADVGDVPLF